MIQTWISEQQKLGFNQRHFRSDTTRCCSRAFADAALPVTDLLHLGYNNTWSIFICSYKCSRSRRTCHIIIKCLRMNKCRWLSGSVQFLWEISFPAGRGGDGGEDVLLLEVEVAPVLRALERLQRHRRRRLCKVMNTIGKARFLMSRGVIHKKKTY